MDKMRGYVGGQCIVGEEKPMYGGGGEADV